ncbi:hypothetical protein L1887_55271 [Cichorium endivia]|nr:hypothetical protein L1887_55271 [Cichorium endivia]
MRLVGQTRHLPEARVEPGRECAMHPRWLLAQHRVDPHHLVAALERCRDAAMACGLASARRATVLVDVLERCTAPTRVGAGRIPPCAPGCARCSDRIARQDGRVLLLVCELHLDLALVADEDSLLLAHLSKQQKHERAACRHVEEEEQQRPECPEHVADVDKVVRARPSVKNVVRLCARRLDGGWCNQRARCCRRHQRLHARIPRLVHVEGIHHLDGRETYGGQQRDDERDGRAQAAEVDDERPGQAALCARLVRRCRRLVERTGRRVETPPSGEEGANVERDPDQRPKGGEELDPHGHLVVEELPDDKVERDGEHAVETLEEEEAVDGVGHDVRALSAALETEEVEALVIETVEDDGDADDDEQTDDSRGDGVGDQEKLVDVEEEELVHEAAQLFDRCLLLVRVCGRETRDDGRRKAIGSCGAAKELPGCGGRPNHRGQGYCKHESRSARDLER